MNLCLNTWSNLDIDKFFTIDSNLSHRSTYLFPTTLEATHDEVVRKVQRDAERLVAENARKEARKNRRGVLRYRARFGKLLAVSITDGDIEIRPLQNRREYIEEGEAMHHCVATYWDKPNSFILSVRQDGVRVATVEMDRRDFSIKQCRAACNEKPQRYDEICEIKNSHRYLFAQAIKGA